MIHSISYAELESLSTQTLCSFAAEIIGELERLGEHPQLAQTLGFIRRILQTRGVVKQPKPRGPGF